MKSKIVMICAMLLTVASGAHAAPYLSVSAGYSQPSDSTLTDDLGFKSTAVFKPGFVLSGAVGNAFCNGLRVEGEVSYRQTDFDKIKQAGTPDLLVDSKVWALSALGNVFYDIRTGSVVRPYIGAGLGFSDVNVGDGTAKGAGVARNSGATLPLWTSEHKTVFAYQVGTGVGIDLSKRVILDLGYRFFGTEDIKFDFSRMTFNSHNVTVCARVLF